MADEASLIASRNTSRGCTRVLPAVPEVISTRRINRFRRLRHKTQNFSTLSPRQMGRQNSAIAAGSSNFGINRVGLLDHAAGDLHHGDELERFDMADSFVPFEILLGPFNQRGEGAGLRD